MPRKYAGVSVHDACAIVPVPTRVRATHPHCLHSCANALDDWP